MTQAETQNMSWLARLQANYSTTFAEKHYVSTIAGTEIRWSRAKSVIAKMYGYDPVTGKHVTPLYLGNGDDGSMTESDATTARNLMDALSTYDLVKNAFASFYGAFDYSFDNRYVFNATVRSDGSNNFGSKEQFNLTWSTGVAWNIDEERFFRPLKPIVNRATVRLSTGLTGGVNKNAYPQLIMNYSDHYRTSATDSYRVGSVNNELALRPEKFQKLYLLSLHRQRTMEWRRVHEHFVQASYGECQRVVLNRRVEVVCHFPNDILQRFDQEIHQHGV